jgi:hypothetical protein
MYGSSVGNLLLVSLLAPRILSWLLEFWKAIGSLLYGKLGWQEVFPLLGCYTACVGSWLQTFRDSLAVSYFKGQAISEEQRPQLNSGVSLKCGMSVSIS